MGYSLGDVIVKCKPFVHTLNANQKGLRCDHCFQLNDDVKKCTKCESMYYCDQTCQRRDWSAGHRYECPIYANHYQRCLTGDCDRLLLRLLLLTDKKPDVRSQSHPILNGQTRCFDDLMTHEKDIGEDRQRMINFEAICDRFRACLVVFDWESLFQLFCRLCINSFSVLNEDLNTIGSGIYIAGSVLNHSCVPNASINFDGIELQARALKPIADGEEVLVNYLDLKATRSDRQQALRQQYYFDCNCLKCVNHLDSNIDYQMVKSLDKQFDELIETQDDWDKCYSIGVQSLALYKQIYEDFHPDLTVQLIRVFKAKLLIVEDLNDKSILEMIKTIRDSIQITHGFEHNLFKIFMNTISG